MLSYVYTRFEVGKYYIGKNIDKSVVVFNIIRKSKSNKSIVIKVLRDDAEIHFTTNQNITLFDNINYGNSAICFANAVELKDDGKLIALLM